MEQKAKQSAAGLASAAVRDNSGAAAPAATNLELPLSLRSGPRRRPASAPQK